MHGDRNIKVRLDRGLADDRFLEAFDGTSITHIQTMESDNYALLINHSKKSDGCLLPISLQGTSLKIICKVLTRCTSRLVCALISLVSSEGVTSPKISRMLLTCPMLLQTVRSDNYPQAGLLKSF
jgi:hypothetical protein